MTLTRGGPRLRFQVPAVAALCALLVACGGDEPDASPDAAGTPNLGSSAPSTSDAGAASGDEYCDRLLAAMEAVGQETDPSEVDFEEMAGRVVEELRGVQPYAPESVADDLETFIQYYERIAAGDFSADSGDSDEFVSATTAVFGECAAAPMLPPIGS